MNVDDIKTVAVIGAGLIGQAAAVEFADDVGRCEVRYRVQEVDHAAGDGGLGGQAVGGLLDQRASPGPQ